MMSRFSSIDPASGESVWEGPAAGADEVAAAVRAAREAVETWSRRSLDQRAEICRRFAQVVQQHKSRLSEAISREIGKPRWEANTEVDSVIGKVELSVKALHERRAQTELKQAGVDLAIRYRPHGVVAVFGPFNFPAHLPNGHIVPALLAGNAVIFKPSEAAPRVAEVMCNCWQQAGLPGAVLQLLQGGRGTGRLLVCDPGIDGIFFTGSFAAGRAINEALASEPGKILALEMGGNNPLVVADVSELDAAALCIIQSAYLTAGQRCTCARRLIVLDSSNTRDLLDRLAGMIARIRVGRYSDDPEPFMGPVISDVAAEKVLAAQEELRRAGGKALVEVRSIGPRRAMLSPGLIDTTGVARREDTEIFGPLLQVIRLRNMEQAIQEANDTLYGLAAGLLADDRALWEQFRHRIRAGVINWNRPTTGASGALPFGGVGRSGNNRPSGYFAADYCSYPVASMESPALSLPKSLPPGLSI